MKLGTRLTRQERLLMLLKRTNTAAISKYNLGGRLKPEKRTITLASIGAGNDRAR